MQMYVSCNASVYKYFLLPTPRQIHTQTHTPTRMRIWNSFLFVLFALAIYLILLKQAIPSAAACVYIFHDMPTDMAY